MWCKRCDSENPRRFNGELAIHFIGFDGIDKPIVWVFPDLAVCFHCGFTEFTVPERELTVLSTGKVVEGAAVLTGKDANQLQARGTQPKSGDKP
jgi:hypothetical protein